MKARTVSTLTFRLALAAAILFAGLNNVAAQVAQSNNNGTPALMLGFTGTVNNSIAELTWTMENQTNCKYFVIERSGDAGGYDSLSMVDGINNNNTTTYTFTDANMLSGNNYYRLRQVDRDGVTRYSKVVTLAGTEVVVSAKMAVYPNPAAATLNYSINSNAPQQVLVQVYSLSGVMLMSTQQQLFAGVNQQSIALTSLHNGNYFLKITNREGSTQYIQSFVKMM